MKYVTLSAALAAGLLASSPAAGPPLPEAGGTVTLKLRSPQAGLTVLAADRIDWTLDAFVSEFDNLGLALVSVDLVQDPNNPELFDVPPGLGVSLEMRGFDRPKGFANPGNTARGSGFGGTQIGLEGSRDLAQIGGAQNTFGVTGPCLGPNQEICYGQDVNLDLGIGQDNEGQLITLGFFDAPATPGTYTFHIQNAVATTLEQVNAPPAASVVQRARTVLSFPSISFTVQ